MNIENINTKPQTKELEKADILASLKKETFKITGFDKNNYSLLNNSPEDVSNLCEKYNASEQFLKICSNNLDLKFS